MSWSLLHKKTQIISVNIVGGTGYESRQASKSDVFVMILPCHVVAKVHTKFNVVSIDRVLSLLFVQYSLVFSGY